ncbi:carbamoyltransferase C-terminal domain-containing protein [Aliiruegeria lutimaris]|uniref:carbamoyltransferase C-terminal domain-containing protein n=1 Tax=Aliiruegeria lutimaris TaxID=571298 RepID=UPI00147D0F2E|nr:carbamoyltransferase C-terminal domain-containing protein [Aliiruegeria lutimaris]
MQTLLFSYEGEKDSFPRNSSATVDSFIDGALWFDDLPDVLALTGNSRNELEHSSLTGAGCFGVGPEAQIIGKRTFFGRNVHFFSSTHERAHIWSAYGMSPFPQGAPCYVLVWDDVFGDFYEVNECLEISHIGHVMDNPCQKFSLAYRFANKATDRLIDLTGRDDFGKMMGSASFGDSSRCDPMAASVVEQILASDSLALAEVSPVLGISVESSRFRDFAARLSDSIFSTFEAFARRKMKKGYPLLISGEGALNCYWTTRWSNSGIFPYLHVSPSANDVGCAIGTAVDAMRHFAGVAKLNWSVYSGQPYQDDCDSVPGLIGEELNYAAIAARLEAGQVIGWANGNCEIGRRALGNRSILATPFDQEIRRKLNRIKERPEDCPVAPICLEEDAHLHFDGNSPSPYMLRLHKVIDDRLGAVTHVDKSARIQTVSREQHPMLHTLLKAFKQRTGVGVLCNTSLNFKGAGFINKTSDLNHFAQRKGLDGFVAGIRFYQTCPSPNALGICTAEAD